MDIIEIIKVIILGIVEGVTEWLPISSTGHMILIDEWLNLNVTDQFMEMFLVVIQLGAILAVVVLFFNKLNPLSLRKTSEEKMDTWHIWFKVFIGILPAGIIGILFDEWLYDNLFNYVTVAVTLILYGVLFIIIENKAKDKKPEVESVSQLSYRTAFLIGVIQVLALIPGTSRSGVTILGALLLGTSRFVAAEFSFFLSIPVMFGASAIKLWEFGFEYTTNEYITLIVGMITAFVVSIIAIKFLLSYIKKNDFKVFGWYRICLGIIVLLYFIIFG